MATYLTDLLDRVVALQIEAMRSINVRVDAVPYFFYTQEKAPYFTNRIADTPITDDGGSEDENLNQPTLIMRLVIGHVTEGYRGEPDSRLYEWLPVINTYFQRRMWLQSVKYPERMDNLREARITNGGGIRAFQNDGIGSTQIGAEIVMSCIFYEGFDQEYY